MARITYINEYPVDVVAVVEPWAYATNLAPGKRLHIDYDSAADDEIQIYSAGSPSIHIEAYVDLIAIYGDDEAPVLHMRDPSLTHTPS